jgi:glycosyltransferase involved in cell wall biosynthesis
MKIGIYNAPGGDAIGGAELCVAVLGELLRLTDDVEILHHKGSMTAEKLSTMFDVDLSRCAVRQVDREEQQHSGSNNPITRFREARDWGRSLSAGYDLFIEVTQDIPHFCHARRGIVYVLFPNRPSPADTTFPDGPNSLLDRVKYWYQRYEWSARIGSYDRKVAISEFTRRWTRKRWHVDPEVVYPPGGRQFAAADQPRDRLVLAVGRFTTVGHLKRQKEMVTTFGRLQGGVRDAWRFACVGNLTSHIPDRQFFDEVRALASDRVDVQANLDRTQLDDLFAKASIFWHASGFDVDEAVDPSLVEHYGLVTTEAMAAGCIPVVIDRGGQREIVEHGVSGFLWETLDQLRQFTDSLIVDDALRERMRRAAIERARSLGKSTFTAGFTRIIDTLR